jgi:hypothetical protein
MIFQAAATIALLMTCSLGPGLLFIRYLRWRPLETLCGSVALSFLLLYLTTFAIYIFALPAGWAYVPSVLAAIATLVCWRDLRRLWRNRETRATMLAFLALVGWLFVLLLPTRNYAGGRWFGDWYEHFHRARFFAAHLPLDTKFLDIYLLPARPPMMNLLAAAFFWQVGPSFEVFQVVFSYLNALALLPCALVAPSLIARTRNRAWLIAGFLALNPMFVQNATYTWTKLFAGFYELTALGLYLSAWRRGSSSRMVAACACFAIGMLVHYSVAPMILFVAGHYLFFLFRGRKQRWLELFASAAAGCAIFATWLAWSLAAYGWHDTFASNTTVASSQELSWSQNVAKVGQNIYCTLVPAILRGGIEKDFAFAPEMPPQGMAYLRDECFAIYQPSFPAALGLGGLLVVSWVLTRLCIRRSDDRRQHRRLFWVSLILFVSVVGIAVHGDFDYLGVAHICLQPILLLGITLAAVGLPHVPRWFREIALVGLLVDAGLGIFLHFFILQTHHDIARVAGEVTVSHTELGISSVNNGVLKFASHVDFLGDHTMDYATLLTAVLIIGILLIWQGLSLVAKRNASTLGV